MKVHLIVNTIAYFKESGAKAPNSTFNKVK